MFNRTIRILLCCIWAAGSHSADAQLSGTLSIPGTYTSLVAALADLNTQGVNGPVTVNIQAGYTETAPSGGFSLTATGTVANPIVFQKSGLGANPLLTAYTGGTGTPASAVQDGVWRFLGCDYITVDAIDITDPNTTNPSTMEYGYGFFKTSSTNGCQNNTIQNCNITLNSLNNATGSGPATDGSRGINVVNSLATFQTSNVTPSSPAGSNSNNKFYGNAISNCNIGVAIIGYVAPNPFTLADTGNEIGSQTNGTGNNIYNFGGAPAPVNAAAGIRTLAQYNFLVANNSISNNNGFGANHTAVLRGIFLNTAISANVSVMSNSISLSGGGTNVVLAAIENLSGATPLNNTVTISNNLISNCTNTNNTTGTFYGIYNNAASCANLNVSGNVFTNLFAIGTTGSSYMIYNTGAVAGPVTFSNNVISSSTYTASGAGNYYGIYNGAAIAGDLISSGNTFTNCNLFAATGSNHFVYNTGTAANINFDNNLVSGVTYSASGAAAFYAIYNNAASTSTLSIRNNSVTAFSALSAGGATHLIYNRGTLTNTFVSMQMQSNMIVSCTFSSSSNGAFYHIWNNGVTTTLTSISDNTVSGNNWGSLTSLRYIISNWGVSGDASIVNNLVTNCTSILNTTGQLFVIYNNNNTAVSSGSLGIANNSITACNFRSSTGDINLIQSAGVTTNTFNSVDIRSNRVTSCTSTITGSGVFSALYNNIASAAGLQLTNNLIQGNSIVSASGVTYFIYNRGQAGSLFSSATLNGNTISGNTFSSTANGGFVGIQNAGVATTTVGTLGIAGNTFSNNICNSTTSAINLIYNTGPVITSAAVTGNLISDWTNTLTTTGTFVGIQNAGASSAGDLAISNNTLTNLFSTASTGARFLIYNSGAISNSITLSGNLISNATHSASSSAALYHIYNNSTSANTLNISQNTMSNCTSTLQSGATHLVYNSSALTNTIATVNILTNVVNGFTTSSTTGAFYGVYSNLQTVNSLSAIGNSLTNIVFQGATNAKFLINNNSTANGGINLNSNVISNVTALLNTTGSLYGVYNSGIVNGTLAALGNSISTVQVSATTGTAFVIYNIGTVQNLISFANNYQSGLSFSANTSGAFEGLYNNSASCAALSINSNTFVTCGLSMATGPAHFFYSRGLSTNTITNINITANIASGITHAATTGTLFGVLNTGISASTLSISGNTISALSSSNTTSPKHFVSNTGSVSTSIDIIGNTIANVSCLNNTTGSHFGIVNSGNSSGAVTIQNNNLASFSLTATTATLAPIFNSGTCASSLSIVGNSLSASSFTLSGLPVFSAFANNATASSISISNNSFSGNTINTASTSIFILYNSGSSTITPNAINFDGNQINNTTVLSTTASIFAIYNNSVASTNLSISSNSVTATRFTGTTGNITLFANSGAGTGSLSISGNAVNTFTAGFSSTALFSGLINSGSFPFITVNSNSFVTNQINGGSGNAYMLSNTGIGSTLISMNANEISATSNSVAGSCNFVAIINSAGCNGNLELNNNSLTGNSTAATGGSVILIRNEGNIGNNISISGNSLSQVLTNTQTPYSGELLSIHNSGSASGSTLSILSNTFSNYLFSGPNGVGNIFFIKNSGANLSSDISSNVWSNLVLKHDASEYLIQNIGTQLNLKVNSNAIAGGYTRTGSAGPMYLYLSGPSATGTVLQEISGNNFSGITATVAGNGSFYGIYSADAASSKTISGNNLSNINYNAAGLMYSIFADNLGDVSSLAASSINSNTVANISWAGQFLGLQTGTVISGALATNIYLNSIHSVTASAGNAGTYGAVLSGSGSGVNFYRNVIAGISDLGSGSVCQGLQISNSAPTTIYNNLIGNIGAPNSTAPLPAEGIHVVSGPNVKLYYNTVYLNTSSSGPNFGSNGLFVNASVPLELRNNIIINNSISNGSGLTAAFRHNGSSLSNYSSSSNNNILYAGIPSAARVIYTNGTNSYSTVAAFQAAVVPRESSSFSENTPFSSTATGNSGFLHVNNTQPSFSESGAVNISGFVDDYDGQVRQGNPGYAGTGTAPDIGADEFTQSLTPCNAANAGTIAAASGTVLCEGETGFLYSTGASTQGGIVNQWKESAAPGGPYVNVTSGNGINYTALTTGTLTAGNHYFVLVSTCTQGSLVSTSNELTLTVNAAPGATATVSSPSICGGSTVNFTGSSNGSSYLWTGPNSYSSTSQNPVLVNVQTDRTGVYTLTTLLGNCSSSTTLSLFVNPMTPTFSIAPVSASICIGNSQLLTASIPLTTPTLNFGNQNLQNSPSGYPAPYTAYYGGQKMQILILASELAAAGFTDGTPVTSIQFPVVSLGSGWGSAIQDCQDFKVGVKSTTIVSLTAFQGGMMNVVPPGNYTPTVGYSNQHNFIVPYVWDGTSNLIIETVFSNSIIGTAGTSVIQNFSTTGFLSTLVYRADNQSSQAISAATNSNTNTSYVRPDFRLNGQQVGNYSWSPSAGLSTQTGSAVIASPSASTIYTATLSNGQCVTTASANVQVFFTPTVNISGTSSVVCLGNSATLTAAGAPNFSWNTGSTNTQVIVTPTSSTIYTVQGINGICPNGSNTVGISLLPALSLTASVSPLVICEGVTATLSAAGANSYSWINTGAGATLTVSPVATTIYTLQANSGAGCSASRTLSLKVNANPNVSITASGFTICLGEEVSLHAFGANSYTWTSPLSFTSGIIVSPTVSMTYQVNGKDNNNCTGSATHHVEVLKCTGLSELMLSIPVEVYPSPSTGKFYLRFESEADRSIKVFDAQGNFIRDYSFHANKGEINLGDLARGLYIIRVEQAGSFISKKVILE